MTEKTADREPTVRAGHYLAVGAHTIEAHGSKHTSTTTARWTEQPGYTEHEVVITATATGDRLGSVTVVALNDYSPAGMAAQAASEWVLYAPQRSVADHRTWNPLPAGGITATAPTGATATLTDEEIVEWRRKDEEGRARWQRRLEQESVFRALIERIEQGDESAIEELGEYERQRCPWGDTSEAIGRAGTPPKRGGRPPGRPTIPPLPITTNGITLVPSGLPVQLYMDAIQAGATADGWATNGEGCPEYRRGGKKMTGAVTYEVLSTALDAALRDAWDDVAELSTAPHKWRPH